MPDRARRRPHGTTTLAALLSLALFGLVGCTGDGAEDPTKGDDGLTSDGYTTPGTTLDLGQKALLPVGDNAGLMELTVTSIEAGSAEELEAMGYDGPPATPYFVRMEVKVAGGAAPGVLQHEYVSAWAGDTIVPHLVQVSSKPPCETKFFSGPALGRTISTCATYLVDDGKPAVDRVQFDNSRTGSDTEYSYGQETAVTWEKPPRAAQSSGS